MERDDPESQALRAVIERRMADAGLNIGQLWSRVNRQLVDRGEENTSRDRLYKAMSGARGLTPETLKLIADGLNTTVVSLRREAGVLTPAERRVVEKRVRFEDFIRDDPELSDEAKDVMTRLYRQLSRQARP